MHSPPTPDHTLTLSLRAVVPLRPPDELGALALAGGGVEHGPGDAGLRRAWLTATAALQVLLQLHLYSTVQYSTVQYSTSVQDRLYLTSCLASRSSRPWRCDLIIMFTTF